METKPRNFGVIGISVRGSGMLAELLSVDGVKVTAICDKYEDRALNGVKIVQEKAGNKVEFEKEMGDVFFALTNYARFLGVNPENALRLTNQKFISRFNYVEKKIKESGKSLTESTLAEMDKFWEESKKDFN